jgi:uncharacterized membrane protein (DUF4010 family)
MGAKVRKQPELMGAGVAGAALSSVATVIQLAIVLGVTSVPLLSALAWPLLLSGLVALIYGASFTWRSIREGRLEDTRPGRAFRPLTAIGFAALMSSVIIAAALLVRWLGPQGALLTSAVAGFADTHASAASAGLLVQGESLSLSDGRVAVLLGFTTNALTKAVVAGWSGGMGFVRRLLPGLVLMVAAAWAGLRI